MAGIFSPGARALGEQLAAGNWPRPIVIEEYQSAMESAVYMVEGFLADQGIVVELPPTLAIGWDLYYPGPVGHDLAQLQLVPCLNPELCPLNELPEAAQDHFEGRVEEFYTEVNAYIRAVIGVNLAASKEIVVEGDNENFTLRLKDEQPLLEAAIP